MVADFTCPDDDDMEIIDGMPASKPKDPAHVRAPWED